MKSQEQIYDAFRGYLLYLEGILKIKFETRFFFETEPSIDGKINAKITKENDTFIISFTEYFIKNIADAVDFNYFVSLTEEKASECSNIFHNFLFRYFEGTTCLIEFKNLVVYIIVFNVLNHELSHFLLDHFNDNDNSFCENENLNCKYGIASIAKEYCADSIGELLTLSYIYDKNFSMITNFNIKDINNTACCMRQFYITFYTAMFIQYDLFRRNSYSDSLSWDMNENSHPHPFVRLINFHHLLIEFIVDRINESNNTTDYEAGDVVRAVTKDIVKTMDSFFKDNFNILFKDIVKCKNAWLQRFEIIDFFNKNASSFKPIISFMGLREYSKDEKDEILSGCI